jgi:MFS family permease
MFAILLGLARISYARFGKNIRRTLLLGMIGSTICYMVAGLSLAVVPAFLACIVTGFCVAMLWPGTLILMEENIPNPGVAAYALMAAGGDLGASISPQLLGVVIDQVSVNPTAIQLSQTLGISPEQLGLKTGMLITALFPLCGTILLIFIIRYFRRTSTAQAT